MLVNTSPINYQLTPKYLTYNYIIIILIYKHQMIPEMSLPIPLQSVLLRSENGSQVHGDVTFPQAFTHGSEQILEELQDKMQKQQITSQQLDEKIREIEKQWQYRYTRLLDYACRTGDWFKLFAFLGQFKANSIRVVKKLIGDGLHNVNEIDEVDNRYNQKKKGEQGIYFKDNIIVRVAAVRKTRQSNPMKSLEQQFLSCNVLNNLSLSLAKDMPLLPRMRVPLSCLVYYLGFVAFCQADSQCDGLQTLVYGPTGSIYQYRQQYEQYLEVIGRNLNLKSFTVLSSDKKSVRIPFSLTAQLHKITKLVKDESMLEMLDAQSPLYPVNGVVLKEPQYYLLNVSKLWPLFIDSDIIKSVGYLRPEVVISNRVPLSNVVFCEVSEKSDMEGELQLADACKKVKEDHVQKLAKILDETTVFIVDSKGIEEIMHEYGINLRYLGQLAQKVTLQFNKKILETEMLARVSKRVFFRAFHEVLFQTKKVREGLMEQYKESVAEYLNMLIARSKESEVYYKSILYPQIKKYYSYQMREYPPDLQGRGLLHAVSYHFGVKLSIVDYPFFQSAQPLFNSSRISSVRAAAKTYDLDTCQIKQYCRNFKAKRREGQVMDSIRDLKILATIARLSFTFDNYFISPLPQAYFYTQIAQSYLSINELSQAYRYAQLAVRNIPDKHSDAIKSFRVMLKCHSMKRESNKCVEYHEKSLSFLKFHLGTNHPLSIEVYNTFAFETLSFTNADKCENIFLRSLEICQRSLGYTHSTSSEILLKLAQLPLKVQKKINYYLQGLTILQNLQQSESNVAKIRKTSQKVSEIYYKLGNIPKMIDYARKSGHWMMEVLGQSKLAQYKNVLLVGNRVAKNSKEIVFLFTHTFHAYMQLIEQVPKNNLYKLFVSLKDDVVEREQAMERLLTKLQVDRKMSTTVTEFIRGTITTLILQLPEMIQKPTFYLKLVDDIITNDKKSKNTLEAFRDIVFTIGIEEVEKTFNSTRKAF